MSQHKERIIDVIVNEGGCLAFIVCLAVLVLVLIGIHYR